MNDHLKDSEAWLKCANFIMEENPRVSAAMSAHALIKALDALFEAKLGSTPKRHDNATDFFKELLNKNLILAEESKYRWDIQNILKKKSSAEYHTVYFSKTDAMEWARKVAKIHDMVQKYL